MLSLITSGQISSEDVLCPRASIEGIEDAIAVHVAFTEGFDCETSDVPVHDPCGVGFVEKEVFINVRCDGITAAANWQWEQRDASAACSILGVAKAKGLFVLEDFIEDAPRINGVDGDAKFSREVHRQSA